ncbi:MAG: nuclear transport factor 2 family protein [Steroidobacteraceae bacterium]
MPSLTVRRGLATALACALLSAGSAGAHEGESHAPTATAPLADEERAVAATLEQYAQALSANDLTRVQPLLVDGDAFSFFEGSYVNVGWQSYHDHLAPEMAMFEHPAYRITDLQPFVRGDLAYATFSWAMDVTVVSPKFESGRHAVSMAGKGTAVLSRVGGQWRIRHLHTAQAPARKAAASH